MWDLDKTLSSQKSESVWKQVPQITLENIAIIILYLMIARMLMVTFITNYLKIDKYRKEHEVNAIQYSYFYFMAMIIMVLSGANWNVFDLNLWIISIVLFGMLRKILHIAQIEKDLLLNDYSYNNQIIKLLNNTTVISYVFLFLSLIYILTVGYFFIQMNFRVVSLMLFPASMLAIQAFLMIYTNKLTSENLICFYNNNIEVLPVIYKIVQLGRVVTSGVYCWHCQNFFRLFLSTFMEKLEIIESIWALSIINVLYLSCQMTITSVKNYFKFHKLLKKIDQAIQKSRPLLDKQCTICMEQLINCWVLKKCGHPFHYKCLFFWLQNKKNCPMCRTIIQIN